MGFDDNVSWICASVLPLEHNNEAVCMLFENIFYGFSNSYSSE